MSDSHPVSRSVSRPASRRRFLRIAGSSAVIVAAAAGGFALTRTPEKAMAPWANAGSGYDDPRKKALSYAILAPNPHNMQPWLVSLEGEDSFTLSYDLERMLPHTDPFNRQIVIGLGCFLELMRMAAAREGYRADVSLFPEGAPEPVLDGRPVAKVTLVKDADMSAPSLLAHAFDRRSNKQAFDTSRPVSAAQLEQIVSAVGEDGDAGVISDKGQIDELRELSWQALVVEMKTPRTYMESVDVMRFGKAEINANPDGIDMGGAFLEAMALAGVVTRERLSDMNSTAYQQGLDMYEAILASAMGYVYLVTDENTRRDQVLAGRDWLRMNLQATSMGLGIHPLSQALQEYPEMAVLFDSLHEKLGQTGRRVQMFARVGYGPNVSASPRWPIDDKLI